MKKLTFSNQEDIILANERINAAAQILTVFSPGDFVQSGSWLSHDIGQIIEEECDKIMSIIGTYKEFCETAEEERGTA